MKISYTYVPDDEFDPDYFLPAGELYRALEVVRQLSVGSVIALHGQSGHGKTPTAKWLSRETGNTLICLDEFPLEDGRGFDEKAMREAIATVKLRETVIVEGICACRVCQPDVLIGFGPWFERRGTTRSFLSYIGAYNPRDFAGRVATFWVDEPHPLY